MKIRMVLLLTVLMAAVSSPAQTVAVVDTGLVSQNYRYYDAPVDAARYLIRPGEKLTVTFIGTKLPLLRLDVGPEGKIVDRSLGVFDLAGKTLSQARQLLREPLMALYNVTEMDISVSDPYEVAIAVTGAVKAPGLYKGFTSQLVSEIIALAGGVREDGSTRGIVFSGGSENIIVDLDRSHYMGDNQANPCLYAGKHLFVPEKTEDNVAIVGDVSVPREVELMPGDDLELLVALAGGAGHSADLSGVYVLGDPDRDPGVYGNIRAGDVLVVPAEEGEWDSSVVVLGAVARPGRYTYAEGMTLASLLEAAGGVSDRANSSRTTIFRLPARNEWGVRSEKRYPIGRLVQSANGGDQVRLEPSDSVLVPARVGFVRVRGQVRSPGYFMFEPGRDAMHYINRAGGFTSEANRTEISILDGVAGQSLVAATDVLVSDGDEVTVNPQEEAK